MPWRRKRWRKVLSRREVSLLSFPRGFPAAEGGSQLLGLNHPHELAAQEQAVISLAAGGRQLAHGDAKTADAVLARQLP